MNTYLLIKWVHILSSTILFGTGIGTAFFKWITDRSGDVRAIRVVSERVVLADWYFTTPAGIVQPLSGFALVYFAGFEIVSGWVLWSLTLYLVAMCCWLPVVWLQLQMREIARQADNQGAVLPLRYWRYARTWFWLGIPGFSSLVIVYGLMVFKPT